MVPTVCFPSYSLCDEENNPVLCPQYLQVAIYSPKYRRMKVPVQLNMAPSSSKPSLPWLYQNPIDVPSMSLRLPFDFLTLLLTLRLLHQTLRNSFLLCLLCCHYCQFSPKGRRSLSCCNALSGTRMLSHRQLALQRDLIHY